MAKRTINKGVLDSVNKFIKEIKKHYNISAIILFGSYANGTENENSDIDIAIISDDFEDIYDSMAILMGMTWDIDARIEPHPIKKKDYDEVADYFIKEVINTGIKVA
jgi:predicted nucleotidyltransferase